MKRINKSGLSLALVLAGMLTSGVAWGYCCLDSGRCKHNPTTDCGNSTNDYYDWCSPTECCHIRIYQCYPGDTCRARDTATGYTERAKLPGCACALVVERQRKTQLTEGLIDAA